MTVWLSRAALMLTLMLVCPCLAAPRAPLAAGAAGEPESWEPDKTWVFAVSLARFQGDRLHDFDPKERIDGVFEQVFLDRGVPRAQVVVLKDQEATLPRIRESFDALLERSRPGDTLIFYFGSHGGHDADSGTYTFSTYEKWLPFDWAVDAIERRFRGAQALLTTDCCHSGGIVEVVQRRGGTRVSYACLTSMGANQSGSNVWRFMRWLTRGFAGDPLADTDGDGHVALDELARGTRRELEYLRGTSPMFLTTGQFNPRLRLSRTTGPAVPGAGQLVLVQTKGASRKAVVEATQGARARVRFGDDDQLAWIAGDRAREAADPRPSGVSGSWVGRYQNSTGEDDKTRLTLEETAEGTLSGDWDGVAMKGDRLGDTALYLEGQTARRTYRMVARLEGTRLVANYVAGRSTGGRYHGWTTLERGSVAPDTPAGPPVSQPVRLAGSWAGHYTNTNGAEGAETLSIRESADGDLDATWTGDAKLTGVRVGDATLFLEGDWGGRRYQIAGEVQHGRLSLHYVAHDTPRYYGVSALERH